MFLKSLQIRGFKSFADNTLIDFHPGVTAIVGPNGCGKSNVVDAIRWVLGERSAKALRGGEMADVIFNGTDKRKPLGMAEVSLTLSDCEAAMGTEYNELQISRRVFRDGHSDYRLNGTSCRLQDISRMLMDTGIGQAAYSILEQGKVDLLLSSRPEDRRAVFEEAAGITKFKSEKREALRKLEYTEANLIRVSDLLAEHKRRIASLQRQAAKARRYQALLTDVRTLDTHVSFRRYEEMGAEKSELVTSIESLRRGQDETQQEIDRNEQLVSSQREEFRELNEKISVTQQRINDQNHQIQGATNRIEFNEERRRELQSHIAKNEEEIAASAEKLVSQNEELSAAQESLHAIVQTLRTQEAEIENFRVQNDTIRHEREKLEQDLRESRQRSHETESHLAKIDAQIATNRSQSDADERRSSQLVEEFEKFADERSAKESEERTFFEEIDAAKLQVAGFETGLRELNERVKGVQEERNEMEDKVTAVSRELSQKKSRLDVLRQLIATGEGFRKGTQAVLGGLQGENDDLRNEIRGVLSSFINVDPDFIRPIENALGDHLQTVLVSNGDAAHKIIEGLTRGSLGEAVVLPESERGSPAHSGALPDGAISWALDKVDARENVAGFLQQLIGDVVIVESLADARRCREIRRDLSYVTRDGAFLSKRGSIRGGRGEEDTTSVLQRQQEIADLGTDCLELQEELVWHEAALEEITQGFNELRALISENSQQLQEARVGESTLQGRLAAVQREVHQLKSKTEGIEWEKGELSVRLASAVEAIAGMTVERSSHDELRAGLEARIAELDASVAEISAKEVESNDRLGEMRTKLAVEQRAEQALTQQCEPIVARVQELEELVGQRQCEIESYKERDVSAGHECDRLREDIVKAREVVEKFTRELELLGSSRDEKTGQITGLEEQLGKARRRISELAEQRGKEEVKAEKISLRIESLTTYIQERYQIDLVAFEQDFHSLMLVIEEQKKATSRRDKRRATMEAKTNGTEGDDEDDADAGREDAESGEGVNVEQESIDLEELEAAVAEGEQALDTDSDGNVEGETEDNDEAEEGVEIRMEDKGPDWDFVESAVGGLKQRLDSMGPVNLDAIAEYEELEADLERQQNDFDDLENSKKNLLNIIRRLNIESRKKFAETFEQVREHFKTVFKELFGTGSKADLILLDEDDPLESGIEIIAKPPGKKLQSISLLSGGERSMTAVALLFSIYRVKPSPFCVLDELDAPLDDTNIGRFLKMLDDFVSDPEREGEKVDEDESPKSQFIIVTHNKRTMHRADVLYGVTMEEFGVSKLIGMKMVSEREIPSKTKTKAKAAD
jgi:chromosome segregation protein